jgi:hypothetical protein
VSDEERAAITATAKARAAREGATTPPPQPR